jgi:hypothetical protein
MNRGPRGVDCDEFPMASAVEGGPENYLANMVSLRELSPTDNQLAGRKLGRFFSLFHVNPGESFVAGSSPFETVAFDTNHPGRLFFL